MAVRFDAVADDLTRSTGVPSTLTNAVWTLAAWVYFVAFPTANNYHSLFGFNTSVSTGYDILYILNLAGVTKINVQSDNGTFAQTNGTTTLALATWYHLALVRSSNTALTGYVNGVSEAVVAQSQTTSTGTVRFDLGAVPTFSDTCSARFAAFLWWDVALTAADLAQEMRIIRPVHLDSLNTWCPMFPGSGERARDYSGNGRSLTEGGTLTDEDPPPVSWGGPTVWIPEQPAAAGATAPFPPWPLQQRIQVRA